VSPGRRLELLRPRDLGALFRDSVGAYARNLPAFLAVGAAAVVPVELIVSGVGLGNLSGGYSSSTTLGQLTIDLAEEYLVILPLVSAVVIHMLLALADGRRPPLGSTLVSGLESFQPMFFPVVLAAIGVVTGTLLFFVPGVWLAVRWYFIPQAVVLDGARGVAALRRSAALVNGTWWRVFGIGVCGGLAGLIPGQFIEQGFNAWAKSADSAAIALAGEIVFLVVFSPFVGLFLTLLYFDLLARRNLPSILPPVPPPPPDQTSH
jgi:hypothetical protein